MSTKRKKPTLTLDKYDWAELFAQFRDNPDAPHVSRVRRILELLKAFTPELKGRAALQVSAELLGRMKDYQWRSNVGNSTQGIIEVLQPPYEVTGVMEWEYRSVRWLLDLLRSGELNLVHLCEMHETRPECEGWYYGRPNKRFCSVACKQYRYDSAEALKARQDRNAEYNKTYRSNLKRKDAKAKQAVGFKDGYRFRASSADSVKKGGKAVAKGQK